MTITIADGWYKMTDELGDSIFTKVQGGYIECGRGARAAALAEINHYTFEPAVVMTQAEYDATIARLEQERDDLQRTIAEREKELSDATVWGQACDDVRAELQAERDSLRAQVEAQGQMAEELYQALATRENCVACGGKGFDWTDIDGEAEAEPCTCSTEALETLVRYQQFEQQRRTVGEGE